MLDPFERLPAQRIARVEGDSRSLRPLCQRKVKQLRKHAMQVHALPLAAAFETSHVCVSGCRSSPETLGSYAGV
jgi:hypothetical protein